MDFLDSLSETNVDELEVTANNSVSHISPANKHIKLIASLSAVRPQPSVSCAAHVKALPAAGGPSLKLIGYNMLPAPKRGHRWYSQMPAKVTQDDYYLEITPLTQKIAVHRTLTSPASYFSGVHISSTSGEAPLTSTTKSSSALSKTLHNKIVHTLPPEFVAPPPPQSPPPPLLETPPHSGIQTPQSYHNEPTEEILSTIQSSVQSAVQSFTEAAFCDSTNMAHQDRKQSAPDSVRLSGTLSTDAMLKDLRRMNPSYRSDLSVNQGSLTLDSSLISPSSRSPGSKRCSTNYPMATLSSPGSPGEMFRYSPSDRSSIDSGTSSGPQTSRAPNSHFVVVAIDFGTTFSGYAFSFTQEPNSIHMMRKWEGGDPGLINQKTPTCLLLEPDGAFHSFGFSARDFYHDLDSTEAKKWLFFDKFKMVLHYNADLDHNTAITACNGVKFPAKKVFAYSLAFFRDHALTELSDQSGLKILSDDIRWVLTVPAIWKQPAKQFMREAAYEAGLASPESPDQLVIALEPEAASIYCRRLRMNQLVPDIPPPLPPLTLERNKKLSEVEVVGEFLQEHLELARETAVEDIVQGSSYMVVDCGGGTVDITVHELAGSGGRLRELYRASGGPYGSIGVDNEFEKMLGEIFGEDFMEQFKAKRPAGFVDLMIAFESRKRSASPYKDMPLNISLPFSFIDYYKRVKGRTVEAAIRKHHDGEVRWSAQGMLRLTQDAMRKLFVPTVTRIKEAVSSILLANSNRAIQYMFLVGGFAESPLLQMELRKEFSPHLKVIIPQDVGLSILKGAVLFGHDPTIIHVRISRMTYGVGVLNRFVKGKHTIKKLIRRDGIDWCTDIFDKFVITDQPVTLGDTIVRSYTPAKPGQKISVINIYSSEKTDIQFITDPGVTKCGSLVLDLTELPKDHAHKRREIQAKMEFGDTEIKVSAIDVATGSSVKANIDFLSK